MADRISGTLASMKRLGLGIALALLALPATAGASVSLCNVGITASDGTVLRANVFLPAATGHFPTVLTVSGYNKDVTNPTGTACSGSGGLATADTTLTDKGYAVMLVDDRGTGASGGAWDSWGKRTQLDYQDELDWIQAQKWSDGSVAATGGSYMGITSLLVAEADAARVRHGKPRAVKAVWADVPMSDAYRDVTFHGGAVDAGFIPLWLGLTTALSDLPPSDLAAAPAQALADYAEHLRNGYDFAAQMILKTSLGEDAAYDGPFYRLRSPGDRAAQIRVPVVIQGGWWDIFQRGETRLFEQLTHSPHKKLIMSPHYHVSSGPALEDPQFKQKWFDRWLKGASNGVARKPAVNLYPVNGTKWQHYPSWPAPGVTYTPYYLGAGALDPAPPVKAGADSKPLLPVSSPCSRMTTQWTAGAAAGPCETDNNTYEATGVTYTTAPLAHDTQLTGPIMANVWAQLSGASDATLVGVLSDVDASGTSSQVTAGFLLASQRKVDRAKSNFAGKTMVRPFHPFTRASQKPVPAGQTERYRIEIYPTSAIFHKGDRIRLTINGADTPATLTPLPDTINELGGSIRILYGGKYPSSVQLPVAP
jgi:putative CocE/NonD family hydrolase